MVDLVEECDNYYEIKFGRKNKVEKLPAGIENSSTKKKEKWIRNAAIRVCIVRVRRADAMMMMMTCTTASSSSRMCNSISMWNRRSTPVETLQEEKYN